MTRSSKGTRSSKNTVDTDPSNLTAASPTSITQQSLHSARSKKKPGRTPLFCSARLILTVFSCLGFVNMYILRFNMNVSMSWMVNSTAVAELKKLETQGIKKAAPAVRPKTCLPDEKGGEVKLSKPKKGEFVWTAKIQGLLASSFFWGYMVTQIPGGWLAERYGGKYFFGVAIFGSGIGNLLTPMAARMSYKALIVIRVILGLMQGVQWPAMYVIWSRWAPLLERQKLTSLCLTGSLLGMVITFPATAILCDSKLGWPYVYYFAGIFGILWFFFWCYFVYDSPEVHPRITKAEKAYIVYSLKDTIDMSFENHAPTPWISILTCKAVWGLMIAHTMANFTLYTLIGNIAKYMHDALYFDMEQTGPISAIPYVGFFMISVISGVLFDTALAKKYCSRTVARRTGNSIGTLIPGLLIISASFFDCTNRMVALTLLIICISLCGFQYGTGFLTNFVDIAPQHAGVLFGISNTVATVSGISAPLLTNMILTERLPSQWQTVLKMVGGFFIVDCIVFALLASGEIQEWALPAADEDSD